MAVRPVGAEIVRPKEVATGARPGGVDSAGAGGAAGAGIGSATGADGRTPEIEMRRAAITRAGRRSVSSRLGACGTPGSYAASVSNRPVTGRDGRRGVGPGADARRALSAGTRGASPLPAGETLATERRRNVLLSTEKLRGTAGTPNPLSLRPPGKGGAAAADARRCAPLLGPAPPPCVAAAAAMLSLRDMGAPTILLRLTLALIGDGPLPSE